MSKVLVAGAGGYIGAMLVPALLARDHEVHSQDLFWFGFPELLLPPQSRKHKIVAANATAITQEYLGYCDVIVWLGGLSNDPTAEFMPFENFLYNTSIPAYLAWQSKIAGVKRYIFASSCSIYGHVNTPVSESTPAATQTPYGISKASAEIPIKLLHEAGRFETLSFRKGTVGGWSSRMRFDLIVNKMAADALKHGVIKVNDPDALRPILDIEDAVKCYIKAVEDPLPVYDRILNLVSENASVMAVAETVAVAMADCGLPEPRIEVSGGKEIRSYAASKTNADANGYKCDSTIWNIAVSVIKNLARTGIDPDDCRYNNIRTLIELRKAGVV